MAIAASALVAELIAVPVKAHADCGDPGQDPCTGPVPTVDEVAAIMAELTDANIPAANKGKIVTPAFTPEEAATIDDHLNRTNAAGLLPYNFVVTDVVAAPANFAGASVNVPGSSHQRTAHEPIVLVNERGHWLITHDTAWTTLDNFWYNATHRLCGLALGTAVYCRT